LKFIFNKEYGLRIINGVDDKYLDIDLQLGTLTSRIYITTCKQKVYISVNGLHYSDIVYQGDLPSKFIKDSFMIKLDQEYSSVLKE
jgi:hypothetical protein